MANGQMHLWVLLGLLLFFGVNLNDGLGIKDVREVEDPLGRQMKMHYELFLLLNQLAVLAIFFAISVLTSIAFSEFRQRSQSQFYLGLPANPTEKWLSKLLVYLFIIPIGCILLYVLLANGLMLATQVEGEPIRWFTFADITISPRVVFQIGLLYFILPAFSLLAAVWQPKYALIKGISLLVIGFFIFSYFRKLIVINSTGFSAKRLQEITVPSGLYSLLGNAGLVGFLLLGVGLMYTAAYLYFKEKEA